jgi:hypothetical protein
MIVIHLSHEPGEPPWVETQQAESGGGGQELEGVPLSLAN